MLWFDASSIFIETFVLMLSGAVLLSPYPVGQQQHPVQMSRSSSSHSQNSANTSSTKVASLTSYSSQTAAADNADYKVSPACFQKQKQNLLEQRRLYTYIWADAVCDFLD